MRTNRVYRVKLNERGKIHLFNSGPGDTTLVATFCGTEMALETANGSIRELRGQFVEPDCCMRCGRTLDRSKPPI